MKNFIEVTDKDDGKKIMIHVADISVVKEEEKGNVTIFTKRLGCHVVESYEEVAQKIILAT